MHPAGGGCRRWLFSYLEVSEELVDALAGSVGVVGVIGGAGAEYGISVALKRSADAGGIAQVYAKVEYHRKFSLRPSFGILARSRER